MRRVARAVLAVVLLLGVYVLAVGIVVVLGWTVVFALRHGLRGSAAGELIAVALLTTIGLGVAALQRTRAHDEEPGVTLTQEAQPRLWTVVRDLAETVGTRPPDEIRLVPDVNAAVSERSRLLGIVGGRRTLYLGAPLLMGLSQQQLRSVLAHELGHYSGRHTALGGVTYRGGEALQRIIERFGPRSVVGRIFAGYAAVYHALTSAVSRQQELEADDFSAEVAGRVSAISALTELPVLSAAWEHYFEEFLGPVHRSGRRPSDFFDGFTEILEAPRLQEALASFRTEFDERPLGRYDSHPPLSARIARFQQMPPDDVVTDATPALELLRDAGATLHALQEQMYEEAGLEAAPWSSLLHGHEPAEIRSGAALLYRVAAEAEHGRVSLGTVVGSLRGRQLTSWVRPHVEDTSGDNISRASLDLVKCAVDEALMSVAGARVSLAWDAEPRFVDTEGRLLDSGPVVERAVASGDPALLSDWLAERGVDLDYIPDFTSEDPRERMRTEAPRVLAALAPTAGHRKLFCVVLTQGVLLRKANAGDHVAWWTGGKNPGRLLLRRVVERSGRDLLAEQDNTWLPWDRIAHVVLGRGRTRSPRLTITCTDGSVHLVKYRINTLDTGETLPALRYFLEDRFVG